MLDWLMRLYWPAYRVHMPILGLRLKGDPTVPWTRLWNRWYLLLFRWKEVTVLQPEEAQEASVVKVGYMAFHGQIRVRHGPVRKLRFAVRHGRENCTFFAIDSRSEREVPLRIVERTTLDKLSPDVELI